MFHRVIRPLFLSAFFLATRITSAQCPDTKPKITGPDEVGANASNAVSYVTPPVPGHTYSWVVKQLPGNTVIGTSTSNVLSQTWSAPGDYLIELSEGISGNICTPVAAVPMNVSVKPMLTAYFYYEFDATHGCFYNVVTFVGTGEGVYPPVDPSITYEWKWRVFSPPGAWSAVTTGNTQNITFPTTPGITYELNMKVLKTINGRIWTDEITDFVYVDPDKYKPVPVLATPTNPNCLYQAYNFSAVGSQPTFMPTNETFLYVDWDFGDGTTQHYEKVGNVAPPLTATHTYLTPGLKTVTVTLTNTIHCVVSKTITIDVPNSIPLAAFTSAPACVSFPTFFNDLSVTYIGTITKWEWIWGDNTSTIYDLNAIPPTPPPAQIQHIYALPGLKHVTLQVTNSNGCLSEIFGLDVNVIRSPLANFEYGYTCLNTAIVIQDKSSQNGGSAIASREYDYGDGIWTTNSTYTYTSTGLKTVTQRVTNVDGCVNLKSKSFTVHPLPDFVPDPLIGFTWANTSLPLQIQFTDNTLIGQVGNNLEWKFGDGQMGFGKNPVHNYMSPGSYNVEMTCTSIDGCTATYTDLISFTPPIPTFHWAPAEACLDQEVRFTPDPVTGVIVSQEWQYQDEGFAPDPTLTPPYTVKHTFVPPVALPAVDTHSFKSYGTKAVRHVITLAGTPPVVVDFIDYIVVHDTAIAGFTWNNVNQLPVGGPPLPGCNGQEVFFFDQSTPPMGSANAQIVAWKWEFDDPASGVSNIAFSQNASHIFMDPIRTTFNVKLTVTSNDNNCESFIIKVITIKASPPVNYIVNGNPNANVGCMSTPQQTSVVNFAYDPLVIPDPTQVVNWLWEFGDNTSQNGPFLSNISHSYLTSGWKTVILTITDADGCKNSISKQVYINPLPIANFMFAANACEGQPVQFNDLSQPGGGLLNDFIVQWEWFWNDGSTPSPEVFTNNNTVFHTFPVVSGQYTWPVKLRVTTNYGCVNEITIPITLLPKAVVNFEVQPLTPQCVAPQTVQFTDLSTPTNATGVITGWLWDFGDGGTSTLSNPAHPFALAGSYPVTLTVTTANGCPSTLVKNIDINPGPTALFTVTTACEGLATGFDASTSNTGGVLDIIAYNWTFGDGQFGTGQLISHNYATYGAYTVTLAITNVNGCISTTTQTINVNPNPIAQFTFSAVNCMGAPVQFFDNSTTVNGFPSQIMTWQWDFGDGSVTPPITFPANPNISHSFAGPATTYTVRLTVTTNQGCTHFVEHVVSVIPKPLANFSFPVSTCANQSIQFTDLTQPNGGGSLTGWLWNFGDPASGVSNISTAQNPVHLFSASGPFTISLIVTNASGCHDTIQKPITISARPVSNFSADTVCKGTLTSFTDMSTSTSGAISSHLWDFGDGVTSTATNPTHLYGAGAIYNVKLTVTTTAGCVKDTTKQVLVLGEPLAQFSYASPNCAKDSVQFNDLSTTPHGTIQTWKWDFGDGTAPVTITFPANQNVKHSFQNGGTYNVTLTITTSDGCEKIKINTIQIGFKPVANFSSTSSNCAMTAVQFTDLSQLNGGPPLTTWLWTFGDPSSGANNTSTMQNPTHNFTTGGNYTVHLLIHNANGCLDSINKPVTVNDAPVAIFSSDTACLNNLTHFTDGSTTASGNIIAWLWNFGDPGSGPNNTSTLQNPTHIYASSGLKTVVLQVTNSNQCIKDTTMQITVNPKPLANFTYTSVCIGDSTQFNDLSLAPGSAITVWDWNFGDGSAHSTMQNPKHAYATAGTFNVTLAVSNLAGCVDSVTQQVVARPKPTAAFTHNAYFCPQGKVDFQDQSIGSGAAITERLWIFEPGYTSNVPNPSFTFSKTDTTYAVTLIVTDSYGCKDTIVDSVFVKPGFLFTFINDTVCLGYTTHFHAVNQTVGDSLYSIFWNFGEPNSGPNNTSTLRNPSHTYSQPGSYVVKMRAYNSDNCVDSVFRQVTVYDRPQPVFTFRTQPCDSTLYFHDSTTYIGAGAIKKWTWIFGDGSAPVVINAAPGVIGDTSHLYVNVGTYPVTLILENFSGCIDSVTLNVKRYPCIQALYSYQDTLRCARYKVSFGDSSLPVALINQWYWNWGDGQDTTYTAHSNSVSHTYPSAGTYSVTLRIRAAISGTTIRDSLVQMVVIHPTPNTYFSNIPVCLKQITLFHDTSNAYNGGIAIRGWNFGDPSSGGQNTSTLKDPTHLFDTAGYYDVKLITTNRFGCADSITKTTRVFGLPTARFKSSAACQGDPTYFTDSSAVSDTTIGFWKWNFGDASSVQDTSSLQDPSWRYFATGSYLVKFIVKDNYGCLDTIDSTIVVNVTPVSAFTLTNNYDGKQGQVKLTNATTGASGYYWDFGNGKTSVDENPVIGFTEDGSYIIKLISNNEFECSDTTFYEYKLLFKGLYVPNAFSPNNNSLGVRLFKPIGVNLKQYHCTVFDPWGHLVWESVKLDSQGRPSEGWDGTFEGEPMTQGNYFWKISATFVDDTPWTGGDIGQGDYTTMGSVALIR